MKFNRFVITILTTFISVSAFAQFFVTGDDPGRLKWNYIDTDSYSFLSPGSFLANLIYSAHSDCVDSVICKGRFVMKNRVVPGEKEILREASRILKKLEL